MIGRIEQIVRLKGYILKNTSETKLGQAVRADYQFTFSSAFKKRHLLPKLFANPGFLAVVVYRIQQSLENRTFSRMSMVISSLNLAITGAEICHGAQISTPLTIRHPNGIVIGGNVQIGSECVLMHGVTIGQKGPDATSDGGSPTIGDRVRIGAKASVLGKINVMNGTIIGAHALLLTNTTENSTYVGVPARRIKTGIKTNE